MLNRADLAAAVALFLAYQHSVALADSTSPGGASSAGANHFINSADHVHVIDVTRDVAGDRIIVRLRIDDGYHVNANPSSDRDLIPTSLAFTGLLPLNIVYPPPVMFSPKFASNPIKVYEGSVSIAALFPKGSLAGSPDLHAKATVQACTDIICLAPANLTVIP